MKIFTIISSLLAATVAFPAEGWPPKHDVVVITPTESYVTPDYKHEIYPTKDTIFHSQYEEEKHYPHVEHYPNKYYGPPEEKKPHYYDVKVLRKHYDDYLDKSAKFKKHFIQKAVDKTVDVTAKLAQYTFDFISKVAIKTAAELAKNGAKSVIHKKQEKHYNPYDNHHYH